MIITVETKAMEDRARAITNAMVDAIMDKAGEVGASPMEAVAGTTYALIFAMEANAEAAKLVRAIFDAEGMPIGTGKRIGGVQ